MRFRENINSGLFENKLDAEVSRNSTIWTRKESINGENRELKREMVRENFKGKISRIFWLILKNADFSGIEIYSSRSQTKGSKKRQI